jgi:hypothetical protein
MTDRIRYQLFLPKAVSDQLQALTRKSGSSKSAILADAMTAWLNRRGTSELDERFGTRLNTITAALARIERSEAILIETLALFVRYELAIHAPLADNDKVGRAVARDRFNAFITQVGRQLAGGPQNFREALDSRDPETGR